MRFIIFQDSHLGDRKNNEDRVGYSYSKNVLLMVIADGMGGHQDGEVAAEIAVTEITRRFQQEARTKLRKPLEFLESAINAAHRAIVSHAVEKNMLECPRTTCVACVVQLGRAYWAHAGDSRLYLLRDARIVGHTQDHSRVQQLIDSGLITHEQAAKHPDRNKIFSCLGGVVPPTISVGGDVPLQKDDSILLMTDGFWSQVPTQLLGTLIRKQGIVSLLPGLIAEAHRRGEGDSDNISVVGMTWEDQDEAMPVETSTLTQDQFTTSSNTTQQIDLHAPAEDVTEEDIEKAIAEIQSAIRKGPR
jgi:serine/threonine protein phosphatase PrpC